MPLYGQTEDIVPGAAKELNRTVTGIPAGEAMARAWLVCKRYYSDDDGAALFIKAIDSSDRPGVGQITDIGASGTGTIRFDLVPDDTQPFVPLVPCPYAVWVELSGGSMLDHPYEVGEFRPRLGVVSDTQNLPDPTP